MHNKKPLSDKILSSGRTRKSIKSSIAHDINTPLTYAKGNLELLKLELQGSTTHMAQEYLKAIEEGLDRIGETVDVIKYICSSGDENIQNDSVE